MLGNVNERAFETQKKALYTRFSQALPLLPSLNGYGTLEGTYSTNSEDGKQHVDVDTATESFIRDGLSKVMKITNICDNEHLTDCGLPDKIIKFNDNSTVELKNIKTLSKFNQYLVKVKDVNKDEYEQLDTKAGAFETVNGESVLVYYNPNCEPDLEETNYYYPPKVCANFIYDLNGKKGPNTVGKDIGFITALYSTDPLVLAPVPIYISSEKFGYDDALAKCREDFQDAKLPNIQEMTSLSVNRRLVGYQAVQYYASDVHTLKNNYVWTNSFSGVNYVHNKTGVTRLIYCIKR